LSLFTLYALHWD